MGRGWGNPEPTATPAIFCFDSGGSKKLDGQGFPRRTGLKGKAYLFKIEGRSPALHPNPLPVEKGSRIRSPTCWRHVQTMVCPAIS